MHLLKRLFQPEREGNIWIAVPSSLSKETEREKAYRDVLFRFRILSFSDFLTYSNYRL
jgi:hypothetical protein